MPEAHASVSTVLPARRLAECSVVDRAIGSEAAAVGPLAVRRMATLPSVGPGPRGAEENLRVLVAPKFQSVLIGYETYISV